MQNCWGTQPLAAPSVARGKGSVPHGCQSSCLHGRGASFLERSRRVGRGRRDPGDRAGGATPVYRTPPVLPIGLETDQC